MLIKPLKGEIHQSTIATDAFHAKFTIEKQSFDSCLRFDFYSWYKLKYDLNVLDYIKRATFFLLCPCILYRSCIDPCPLLKLYLCRKLKRADPPGYDDEYSGWVHYT